MPAAVQLLKSSDDFVLEYSAWLLFNIADRRERQDAIVAAGHG